MTSTTATRHHMIESFGRAIAVLTTVPVSSEYAAPTRRPMPLVRDRYVTTEADDRRLIESQTLRPHESAAGSDQLDLLGKKKTNGTANTHHSKGFKRCVKNENPGHNETLPLPLPLILGFTPAKPNNDVVGVRGMRRITILSNPPESQQRWVRQRKERPRRPPSIWSETPGHHERRRP